VSEAASTLEEDLSGRLGALEADGLRRRLSRVDSRQGAQVRRGGALLENFSSNDYLGLAAEPLMAEAAIEAIRRYGTGSGASRLISGGLGPHWELEEALAAWQQTEAALVFSSGYAAAVGTISALVGPGDVVILDKLCHACIIDGSRLSGAVVRVFPHNDLGGLERLLRWAANKHGGKRVLVATESVFSMDGDVAPLCEIVSLKERFGAWLLVDEAHAVGVLGERGAGLLEALNLAARVEVHLGTLSKALGGAGGYVCGSGRLVEWVANRARSFMFSTAPSPVVAAVGCAAVEWIQSAAGVERRARLSGHRACFGELLGRVLSGLQSELLRVSLTRDASGAVALPAAIVPVLVGTSERVLALSGALEAAGFWVPPIRYPTVARGAARLRITLSAAHTEKVLQQLAAVLGRLATG
jgi:glycine C-acetyltransferase/8-amino-7-oxononanoate synthase